MAGVNRPTGELDPIVSELTALYARESARGVDVERIVAGGIRLGRRARRQRQALSALGVVAAAAGVLLWARPPFDSVRTKLAPPAASTSQAVSTSAPTGSTTAGEVSVPGAGSGTTGPGTAQGATHRQRPGSGPATLVVAPVSSVTVSKIGATTVLVAWGEAPGATGYTVSWVEQGSGRRWTSEQLPATTRQLPIGGLRPAHGYVVTVSALTGQAVGPGVARSVTTLADVVQAPLAVTPAGGPTATIYFGSLSSLRTKLAGQVSIAVASDYAAAHADQCVLTVVFAGVHGSSGVVYARGLESANWGAAEVPPPQSVSSDAGHVHQQLIVPPAATAPRTWVAHAELVVDGHSYLSASYTLTPAGQDTANGWSLRGSRVGCTPS